MQYSIPFFGILLDSDGTVIDSNPVVEKCWTQLFDKYDIPLDERPTGYHGRPARAIASDVFSGERLEEALAWVNHLEETTVEGLAPLPGAEQFLATLRSEQVPHGVVSSGSAALIAARWGGAGLELPEVVIGFEKVTQGKPHPEPFLRGWEELGKTYGHLRVAAGLGPMARLFPEQPGVEEDGSARLGVVAFEDSPTGLRSAREAGCVTVAATAASGLRDYTLADYVIEDYSQVSLAWRGQVPVLRLNTSH